MSNYYTPDISEFHVGLWYQFYTFDNEWVDCKMGYEPIEIKNSFIISTKGYESFPLFNEMKEYLQNRLDRIRVKYLDRQDIEELGFKVSNEPNSEVYLDSGELSILQTIDVKDNKLFYIVYYIKTINGVRRKHTISILKKDKLVFRGDIKNKSELKTLLKQLNINN